MKKTLTVNLNNIVFHIDDDAYEMLQTYLSDVAGHLSEDEKKEVMNDIEARIAELFTERLQKNKNVVNVEDVVEIIKILGNPNQFSDSEEADNTSSTSEKKRPRRFYRDPENAILGGIGSGIAAYFSWDVTWIRIGLVILAFVTSGSIIPIYLLVWLIAPRAVTASQRLEMQGEDVTVENIKTEINNVKNYVESDKFKQTASRTGERFVDIFRGFFKVIFGFVGAVFGFVGMILIGVLVLLLMFAIFQPGVFENGFYPEIMTDWAMITPDKAVLLIISVLLMVGCPVFILIYWIIRLVSGRREYGGTTLWVVLILWFAGIFMFYSVGAPAFINWKNHPNHNWTLNWEVDNSQDSNEVRSIENFRSIEVSGIVKLDLNQDSVRSIIVSAPQNSISRVKTKVENGILKIYTEDIYLKDRDIKVSISTDSLYSIEGNGASRIKTISTFNSSKMSLNFSGASKADIDLNISGRVDMDLSGASYAKISGKANNSKIEVSGASKLNAENLKTGYVIIDASGASHAEVFASESFDGEASGASKISCEGKPKNIHKSDNLSSHINMK